MRTIQILLIMGLSGWTAAAAPPEVIPLHDGWRLQSAAKLSAPEGAALSTEGVDIAAWYPTAAPRTVLAALADNGVYPDPYYGTNLKSIPGYRDGGWLVMPEDSPFRSSWWYRTEFTIPKELKGRQVTLHFDGINYKANIWLNGQRIAGSDTVQGMFRRFEFPVTALVRYGAKNVLAVETIPPGQIPDKEYDTKQIEATTGWDDHNPQPPDRNLGLWQEVYLRAQGAVALRNPYVETHLETPSLASARLTVSAFLTNLTDTEVKGTLRGGIESISFSQDVTLGPHETREVLFTPETYPQLAIQNPRVWWPHPLGPQELYTLNIAAETGGKTSDTASVRFGIRDITTYINDEDWRGYRVNGHNILIRGGAWMTSEMMLRFDPRRYGALVRYAREANLNMLRSEGFSIRETEEFYNLCDENGIMVTQQIFGRSIPDESLAIACIDDMMPRIRNHPSLAHFLGHDETHPTKNLDEAYRGLIEKYRVNRTYQPHSGTFVTTTRRETGGTRTGTRELWTYAGPAHYYLRKHDGAWGFAQSGGIGGVVAPMDSLRQMMPEDQLWPPLDTDAWSFHTVTQGGEYFDAVRQAMNLGYGAPKDLAEFCNKAYAMNYNSARGMFEAYGRNKYSATGITTWKYDAAWPAAMTWQYIDWYLRATAAYYGAKKACEPLHAQYAYDDNSVYVINSFYEPFENLSVTATGYNFDMSVAFQRQAAIGVEADGKTKAFAVEWPEEKKSPVHFLKLDLRDAQGELRSSNFYWLAIKPDIPGISGHNLRGVFYTRPKSTADFMPLNTLPPVKLTTELASETTGPDRIFRISVSNPSNALAFLVQLAITAGDGGLEIAPVFWSDNYFSLLPGESRLITATVPESEVRGITPALRTGGWNVTP